VGDVEPVAKSGFAPLAGLKKQLAKPRDHAGMFLSVLLIGVAVWAFAETSAMTPMGSVFPSTISVAIIVMSLMLLGLNILRKPAGPEQGGVADNSSNARRVALVIAMIVWVAVIPMVGFGIAAILAFLILGRVACYEHMSAKRILGEAVGGLVIVGGLYLLMAEVLLIRMPTGALF
jgi:putative tricarboxylic transport membrane protein